jgi:hypothetical protein
MMKAILALDLGKFKSVCCFFNSADCEVRYVTVESMRARRSPNISPRPQEDIAKDLGISTTTLDIFRGNVRRKFGRRPNASACMNVAAPSCIGSVAADRAHDHRLESANELQVLMAPATTPFSRQARKKRLVRGV